MFGRKKAEKETAGGDIHKPHNDAFFAACPVPIALTDGKFLIHTVNNAFLDIFGLADSSQILTRNPLSLWAGDISQASVLAVLEKDSRWNAEVQARKADGAPLHLRVNAVPLQDRSGYMLSLHDISPEYEDRQEAVAYLMEMRRHLIEVTALSDQIRNPLTVIAGMTELMDPNASELIQRQVAEIDAIIGRIDQTWLYTQRLRDLVRERYGGK